MIIGAILVSFLFDGASVFIGALHTNTDVFILLFFLKKFQYISVGKIYKLYSLI